MTERYIFLHCIVYTVAKEIKGAAVIDCKVRLT